MRSVIRGRGTHPLKAAAVLTLIVLALAGAAALQHSIDGAAPAGGGWDESSPFDSARSFLDVLGGVRETVAAYLWTKTDDIFHKYLGESLYAEKPIYPYYWLITRLDPHYVTAYFFASWMLCRFGRADRGFELAREGLRNNPGDHLLRYNMAQIYLFFRKDPVSARDHCLKALRLSKDDADRKVYRRFLLYIDDVLAGKREIPDPSLFERREDELLRHEHEHDEEHGHE